ncbi:UNVERIFIED_CONTAM: hypothetical protein HDU68_006315 [Siphonaria sp. JEL0065]|nr:hypothetical protein HDU68_006315 [Siphonaria sp. JEL0065]
MCHELIATLGLPSADDFWFPVNGPQLLASLDPAKDLNTRFKYFFAQYPRGEEVMKGLLTYSPRKRMHVYTVLQHGFFFEIKCDYMRWTARYQA